jgi:hypothetical protein
MSEGGSTTAATEQGLGGQPPVEAQATGSSSDTSPTVQTSAPKTPREQLMEALKVTDTIPSWKNQDEAAPAPDPAAQAETDAAKREKFLAEMEMTIADTESKPKPPPAPRFPTPVGGAVIPSAKRPFTETAVQPILETSHESGILDTLRNFGKRLGNLGRSTSTVEAATPEPETPPAPATLAEPTAAPKESGLAQEVVGTVTEESPPAPAAEPVVESAAAPRRKTRAKPKEPEEDLVQVSFPLTASPDEIRGGQAAPAATEAPTK